MNIAAAETMLSSNGFPSANSIFLPAPELLVGEGTESVVVWLCGVFSRHLSN